LILAAFVLFPSDYDLGCLIPGLCFCANQSILFFLLFNFCAQLFNITMLVL
jgi:hypothetical protein